jgi:replicative DNA helicase
MSSYLTPPRNLEAERALLGSCLLERDAITVVSDVADHEFSLERYAAVWRAIVACYRDRVPPDAVTVLDRLRAAGEDELAGGMNALLELINDTPYGYHVTYYAAAVRRAARLRALIEVGGRIAALGYGAGEGELDAVLGEAERELFAVTQGAGAARDFVTGSALAQRLLDYLSSDEDAALSTGLADLDKRLVGWRASRLYVVAARPGMGKTGFALSTIASACRAGRRVAFYSMEMPGEEILFRLAGGLAGVDSQRIEARRLSAAEFGRVSHTLGSEIDRWDLLVSEAPDESITSIRAKARRAHAERPLDLVVVDYLQLAEGDRGRQATRAEQVTAVAQGLKKLAMELRVPVLAPAQLNREVEGRSSKVPTLSDIRESGGIEQAADVVLFLVRPEYYDAGDKPGVGEVHIAKQRGGVAGAGVVVDCQFHAPSTMWRDLSAYDAPGGY